MKVAIVANFRLRKSRPYAGNCHILTGILGNIFKPITACIEKALKKQHITLHKIRLLHTQITEKIKHEIFAIVAKLNFRLRKSRPYGNCHILTGILGIFKPITALKSD